jgi:O-methyltransferase domain/Dimerisation domain
MTAVETEVPPPAQMLQLLAGFQISQALYVVAKLGVSTVLAAGPRSVAEIAAATGADADPLHRIIRTLTPMGIFRTDGETVEVTPLGLTLAEGQPGSVRDIALLWMETHYGPFTELLHTVMTGEDPGTRHFGLPTMEWIASTPELAALMTRAMVSVTESLRAGMFDDYSLPEGNLVADIGGADGTVLCQLLAREPGRRGIVFDRPVVVPSARQVLVGRGLGDRVETVGGDFFESVPKADVYVMSYILHDWDDESCRRILRNVKKAAAPGARLVVMESVIPPGDELHPSKLVDLTMLGTVTGRERTAAEYEKLLGEAGFTIDRIVPTRTPYSFIEATVQSS